MTLPTNPSQLDAEALYATLLAQVKTGLAGVANVAIVGIHSGGAWLAERLAADLGLLPRLGVIDVSFYRDDYAQKGLHADVTPTQIGFDVTGATIMLVALVDRGGRQLPVAADFVAASVTLPATQALVLQRAATGQPGQFTLTIE